MRSLDRPLPEHLAGNAAALRRFEREAKAVAALSHPHILAIHDFGAEQGVSYAVMELLEGETLRAGFDLREVARNGHIRLTGCDECRKLRIGIVFD